jgi:hypothetical protein
LRKRTGTRGGLRRAREVLPLLPQVQTKQGRERAPAGPGGGVRERGRGLGPRGEGEARGRSGRGRQTKGATSRDSGAPPPLPGERRRCPGPEGDRPPPLAFGARDPRPLPARLFRPALPLCSRVPASASRTACRCRSSPLPPLSSRPCCRALQPRPLARGPVRARAPAAAPPPARGGSARDERPRLGARGRERARGDSGLRAACCGRRGSAHRGSTGGGVGFLRAAVVSFQAFSVLSVRPLGFHGFPFRLSFPSLTAAIRVSHPCLRTVGEQEPQREDTLVPLSLQTP